jgi:glycosyltransferase involved in cell wall biosynthesis
MELEVLVATMDREDLSLAEKMDLRRDAVIANQCGRWGAETLERDGACIRMISSDTRGVGINRNLALQAARGDILLFADDDITYYDGDLEPVVEAFRQLPQADVIFFAIDMTREGKVFDPRRHKTRRLHLWNSLRYGACRIAIRRSSLRKYNLSFSELFGGGCMYSCGEDTIFLRECFRKGMKVYASDAVLGTCARDASSWFSGYTDKFYYDYGALISCAFPRAKHLLKWYFARNLRRKSGKPLGQIVRQMNAGIRSFSSLIPYEEK